jgi:beta-glucosidase
LHSTRRAIGQSSDGKVKEMKMNRKSCSRHRWPISLGLIIPMIITVFTALPMLPTVTAAPSTVATAQVQTTTATPMPGQPSAVTRKLYFPLVKTISVPIWQDTSYSFEERAANLVSRLTLAQKAAQMVSSQANGGSSITVDGKTISAYGWWNEALHGISREQLTNGGNAADLYNTTSYPINLSVGSSWDPQLMYREASMISDEAREVARNNSLDLDMYSPTINLSRDPRWGRNDESYGEDPLLAAAMAAQFVNGMEGKDMNGHLLPEGGGYYKTLTTLKHYTANNSEVNRLSGNSVMDDRALREYYTSVFRKIVRQAQPGSVMSSYNRVNGTPSAASVYLNDNLMRQTFGFGGYFTSDCDAVYQITAGHNWTPPGWSRAVNTTERNAFAITAGEDLECNAAYEDSTNYMTAVRTAISQHITTQTGLFTENDVDAALVRLFTARMKLGEFDKVATEPWIAAARARVPAGSWVNSNSNNAVTETPARLAMAREVAAKSIVLLKNNPTAGGSKLLPLHVPASGTYKVLVIGALANNADFYLGAYSSTQGSAGTAREITPYNGLKAAIQAINRGATVDFARGFTGSGNSASGLTTVDATAVKNAANYDRVIVYVGTDYGTAHEGADRSTLALPGAQASLISQVAAKNPNTIAVMETIGVVDVTPFEPSVPAILWSSYNGMRKGEGLADVVLGNYDPSGRLPFIWYSGAGTNTSVIPAITDYTLRPTGSLPGRTYMYYTGALSYPFGWGLSYTDFRYANLKISNANLDANNTFQVSADVTNAGAAQGNEVVELYVNTPDAVPALQRPIKRLEGFQKVSLNPGETRTVTFAVKVPDLAFYDQSRGKWVVDSGRYGVQISRSSANADIKLHSFVQVTGSISPVPSVITVKPTQAGDAAQDIPIRVLFEEDHVVVPNVTVAMNDDTLYGYIMKNKSKSFPAGMTLSYSSNHPKVVSVAGSGVIRTVGGGVATVTATVTYGGVSKSTQFVIQVQADD